jgi:hypothetical protein
MSAFDELLNGGPMAVEWTPTIVAVVAAIASITGAVIARRGSRDSGLAVAELHAETRALAPVERYQAPLVRAAYDLQSRLFNILERGLLSAPDPQREYVEVSTLWLIGQYFGWQEIVRREAQFLHFPDAADRQKVQQLLGNIARAFSSDSMGGGRALCIQRSEQRAMGEVMITGG